MKRDCKIRPIIFVCVSLTGKTTRSSPTGYFKLEFAVGFFYFLYRFHKTLDYTAIAICHQGKRSKFYKQNQWWENSAEFGHIRQGMCFLLGPTIYLYTYFIAKHMLSFNPYVLQAFIRSHNKLVWFTNNPVPVWGDDWWQPKPALTWVHVWLQLVEQLKILR